MEEVEAEDTCKFLAQTTVAVVEEYFTSETTEDETAQPVGIGECWTKTVSVSLTLLLCNFSLSTVLCKTHSSVTFTKT